MKKIEFSKKGQLILGLNGWLESGHDASAVLIEVTTHSCEILGGLEEEKVTRNKCAFDTFPVKSIDYLLQTFQLDVNDIDYIVFGWNYPKLYDLKGARFPFPDDKDLLKELFPGAEIHKAIPIKYIDHHLAHAASSYRTSGYSDSLIFVLDGQGETESSSIWIAKNDSIQLIDKIQVTESLGYLYEAVNRMLNFQNHESGKTMGLASYGTPRYLDELKKCFVFNEGKVHLNESMNSIYKRINRFADKSALGDQAGITAMWEFYFKETLGISHLKEKVNSFYEFDDVYKDLAASVQALLESIASQMVEWHVGKHGIDHICMSGGVALNCIMNGKLLNLDGVESIFINPAANDAGVSLGAGLELAYQLGYPAKLEGDFFNPFIGIEFENEEIIEHLNRRNLSFEVTDRAESFIAESIAEGHVVALFQGRNEWGPRALGNRSIISSAKDVKRLDYINSDIKVRELGRPLGPSMLIADSLEVVDHLKVYGKYMNIAYKASDSSLAYPAIVHVDQTFRPEFVEEAFNHDYYNQLLAIRNKVGSSIVINTSFNLKTPIIFHIEDAIDYFVNSPLNVLVFNNQIILKK